MMKKVLIFLALLLMTGGLYSQEVIRPTVKAGALSIAGSDTTGEMIYYNHTTGKWQTTYANYLKWVASTQTLWMRHLYVNGNKTTNNLAYFTNDANATKDSTVYISPTGIINHSRNIGVLNKAASANLNWFTRNTAGTEVVGDLNYIGNITFPYASSITTTTGSITIKTTDASGIQIKTNNTSTWLFAANGHLRPSASNSYDIGSSSEFVKDIYLINLNPVAFLGIKTVTPYHTLSNYSATPVWALTNITVNKNVTSAAQAIDSSAIAFDISGEPTIKFRASDGDAGNIAISTSDHLRISDFTATRIINGPLSIISGQAFYYDDISDTYAIESSADILDTYVGGVNMVKITEGTGIDAVRILNAPLRADSSVITPIVSITSTDTISATHPIGSMFMRITASDTSMWVKIRMTGVLSARWKKLTP